uniref:NLR family, CARD domain containing 3-like 1 n=1 Tax=Echeneis naucrates TaxID=173247 RepID=A0A665WIC6_ECHNA
MGQGLAPALSYTSLATESSAEMEDEDMATTRYNEIDTKISLNLSTRVKTKEDTVKFEMDVKRFKTTLWKNYQQSFNTPPSSTDTLDLVDHMLDCYGLEACLQITQTILGEMGRSREISFLQALCIRNEVRQSLCETLKRKYGGECEDLAIQEEKRQFDEVFTDLFISSTYDNGPNIEHEVMNIEKLDSNQTAGMHISTKDIFSAERLQHSNIRLILLTGVAGSGKSTAVRKLILDWIEEQSQQHNSFLFPLPFRELKQFEGSNISLLQIIRTLYPETIKLRNEDFRCDDCPIMFVFDGLDDYSGKLDFENTELLCDHTEQTTLNTIVVNILRGRLLYRGLFLVTLRSQVKRCIPWDTPYDEIEMRGFDDPEKDKYFKRIFKDPAQADRVIAYVRSSKTLSIMCHLPLFCSLVANECRRIFREQGTQAELPRGITYMYTKLMLALIRQQRAFRAPDRSPDEERDFLMKLGKLAFSMLEKGHFKITKSNWKDTGISDEEAVINSGLCTQYLTKPFVLFHEKVLSFIHPTMQEYLAALYAFLSFVNQGKNIFEQQLKNKLKGMFKGQKPMELYKSAVDRSLLCEDGKLDIFLRFLFGMSLQTNLDILQPLCTLSTKWPTVTEDAAALIRKKIRENQYSCRNLNLQHCLEELGVCVSEAVSS